MATRIVREQDLDASTVRRKTVSVSNDATMRSVVDAGEFGTVVIDEPEAHGGGSAGPSPLQIVLGALCACESVTFNRTAAEMDFAYDGIEFAAAFTIDIRGRNGDRSVRPHFQSVKVEATVTTAESDERLAAVIEEAEARCPVLNLVVDADVDVQMTWVHRTP